MTKWKNLKAVLSGVGQVLTRYTYLRNLTLIDLRQYFDIYILRGIVSSLRVKIKFKPQHVDFVNGNHFF